MSNEWNSNDFLGADISEEYTKDEMKEYLSGLLSDFSRLKTMWQKKFDEVTAEKDAALEERDRLQSEKIDMVSDIDSYVKKSAELDSRVKEYESKLQEMNSLREDLTKREEERSDLIKRINEAEYQNSQNREKFSDLAKIKEQLEGKNAALERMYQDMIGDISNLSKEKEVALANETAAREELQKKQEEHEKEHEEAQEAIDKLLSELESTKQANDELLEQQLKAEQEKEKIASEVDNLKSLNEELEKAIEESKNEEDVNEYNQTTDLVDPFYKNELMTDSGFDLLAMLQSMSEGIQDGSAVQVSKSWEEENEEIIDDPNIENRKIVKKVRRKTEVSVKYTNGK